MRIYHIIDHNGFGSIHKLLIPLCEEYSNNIFLRQKIFNIIWKLNTNEKKFIYKSLLLWIYDESFHS